MPVSDLDVISFRVCCCGRIFWGRTAPQRRGCTMMITPLEIKGTVAAVITSVVVLVATFAASGIYRTHILKGDETWKQAARR
jgi:hypothetical protein